MQCNRRMEFLLLLKMIKEILNWLKLRWIMYRQGVEQYPITKTQIEELLKKKFPKAYIEVEDGRYYTTDFETLNKILPLIPIHSMFKYTKEDFDCDDYQRIHRAITKLIFPRLPLGEINVNKNTPKWHALEFIIYKNKSGRFGFTYYEPQKAELRYYAHKPYWIHV